MKTYLKIVFLLLFGFQINFSFSQEIKSIYKIKKEQKKRMPNYYELDSLVLYHDKSFYRKYHYNFHEIISYESKGNWEIKNGLLNLKTTKSQNYINKEWFEIEALLKYSIKRNKLIPINENAKSKTLYKLKLN